ncbi:hypothetical protein [Streptosporangium sp. NPDC020145]|uniref:hypothetical protein n=1 Tax=Streptosporangium sp. NPDC020145 TaxID=3154694 RepID=UPI0034146A4C
MRRWIAPLAAALLAPALTITAPAAAQAAAVDPVKALRQRLASWDGVRIAESGQAPSAGGTLSSRRTGVLRLSPSGLAGLDVVRRDVSRTVSGGRTELRAERVITVGGVNYTSSPRFADRLPHGKAWVSDTRRNTRWEVLLGDQAVNALEPSTLGLLLRTAKDRLPYKGGVQYRGTVTLKRLYDASPSFRERRGYTLPAETGRLSVGWRLWLDTRGLPTRLVTKDPHGSDDIRYTGWGTGIVVTAPPADQVVDARHLGSGAAIERTPNSPAEGARSGAGREDAPSPRGDAGTSDVEAPVVDAPVENRESAVGASGRG